MEQRRGSWGREAGWSRPFAQLRLRTQDPGLAWPRTGHRLGSPSHGPPRRHHQNPHQLPPSGCRKDGGAALPPAPSPSPLPPPLEVLVPCSLQIRRPVEQKQVPPARVVPRSFPQSCLGQKPGRRVASLCGPLRAGHPPHGRSAGSCPQDSPTPLHHMSPPPSWGALGSTELTGGSSEKAMAAHSSVLAWRIPGTGEPGGLPSMGSHRVGHD